MPLLLSRHESRLRLCEAAAVVGGSSDSQRVVDIKFKSGHDVAMSFETVPEWRKMPTRAVILSTRLSVGPINSSIHAKTSTGSSYFGVRAPSIWTGIATNRVEAQAAPLSFHNDL